MLWLLVFELWLGLMKCPSCQLSWVIAGVLGSSLTGLLTGGLGGSSVVLSLSDSDLELLSESLELVDSAPLECAACDEEVELCWLGWDGSDEETQFF